MKIVNNTSLTGGQMLHIGYTKSDKEIYFQDNSSWIKISNSINLPLSPEEIFDGHCLMRHMVTYFIRNNDERKLDANDFALDSKTYLMNLSLWEKLIKPWDASIDLHFAKLGKGLALLEFK
jgi:hypothetical protein